MKKFIIAILVVIVIGIVGANLASKTIVSHSKITSLTTGIEREYYEVNGHVYTAEEWAIIEKTAKG